MLKTKISTAFKDHMDFSDHAVFPKHFKIWETCFNQNLKAIASLLVWLYFPIIYIWILSCNNVIVILSVITIAQL